MGMPLSFWMCCAYCGTFLRFDDDLIPVLITDEEILSVEQGKDLLFDMYQMKAIILKEEFDPNRFVNH